MKKEYDKVFLNEYGYYELKKKPGIEERRKEFEECYYQESMSTYAENYSEEELQFFENKMIQKEMIIARNIRKNISDISLLDLGCGEGFVIKHFAAKGANVLGIDFSDWALKHHNPDMLENFIKGDCLEELPKLIETSRQYDVINIDAALDMMLEPEKVIGLCHKLLSNQGILLIKVANNYSYLQRMLLGKGELEREYWLDDPGHPSYFNKDGLIKFMHGQGFKCADFYGESFIDFNLLNPRTNYYEHPEVGRDGYFAKIRLENMMHSISPEKSLEVFKLLGEMGFGREIIGVFVGV